MSLKINNFWYVLEQLIPFDLTRTILNCNKKEAKILFSETDDNLPWLNENLLKTRYNLPIGLDKDEKPIKYYYRIYLGVFLQRYIFDFWKDLPKPVEPAFSDLISPSKKLSCYFSFLLDHDGFLVDDTLSNSSLPWALGQIEEVFTNRTKLTLDSWTNSYHVFSDSINSSYSSQVTLGNRMTVFGLQSSFEDLAKLHIPWMPPDFEYIAHYTIQRQTKTLEDDSDILNSFYLKDIANASDALKSGNASEPLRQYLSQNIKEKIDVDNVKQLQHFLSPRFLTLGRWPSPSTQNLALMQQCAVNLSFALLEDKGLFSVNGPPGTGKTTLLRELVAELIVKRAYQLVQFDNPSSAFRKSSQVHKLSKQITGFEIVLASSNNGAVENVTAELPSMKVVSDEFRHQFNYFKETAESVRTFRNKLQKQEKPSQQPDQINSELEEDPVPEPLDPKERAWGLIAAVLGNKNNCNKFCSGLWFHKENSINSALKGSSNSKKNQSDPLLLKQEWNTLRQDFLSLKQKLMNSLELKEKYNITSHRIVQIKTEQSSLVSKLLQTEKEITQNQSFLDIYTSQCSSTLSKKEKKAQEISELNSRKPSFFSKLFNPNSSSVYSNAVQLLEYEFELLERELAINTNILNGASKTQDRLRIQYQEISEQISNCSHKIENLSREITSLENQLGDVFINPTWWHTDRENLHASAPWLDEELNKLRTELFSLALRVHESFIRCARKQVMANLSKWVNLVLGIDRNFTSTETLYLWQTLFLLVPVISTTFASVQRLFNRIESESFGWLLIDEAGQATPQAVVGALQRSKRVIAVGDPLQIKPVFTVDEAVVRGLQNYFDIEDIWSPLKASVQTLSDRVNPYGTYLKGEEEPLWIGCPLWVHRRCLNPMLEISNRIAYDGKMIMKTGEPDEGKTFPLGESKWFDINGSCEGRHWVPAQGEKVLNCLEQIVAEDQILPNLFIISPFRAVAQEVCSFLWKEQQRWSYKLPNSKEKLPLLNNWLNKSVGTVHTFQGKEADTVILVLGIDHRSQAAAQWAASEPNILNVAATRAKYRFYIIGSKKIWSSLRYFEDADKLLPN